MVAGAKPTPAAVQMNDPADWLVFFLGAGSVIAIVQNAMTADLGGDRGGGDASIFRWQ